MSGENSGGPSERFNQVIAEYLSAVEAGEAPDRDELLAQHPELADDLKSFFADQDRLQSVMNPPTPDATPQEDRPKRRRRRFRHRKKLALAMLFALILLAGWLFQRSHYCRWRSNKYN